METLKLNSSTRRSPAPSPLAHALARSLHSTYTLKYIDLYTYIIALLSQISSQRLVTGVGTTLQHMVYSIYICELQTSVVLTEIVVEAKGRQLSWQRYKYLLSRKGCTFISTYCTQHTFCKFSD